LKKLKFYLTNIQSTLLHTSTHEILLAKMNPSFDFSSKALLENALIWTKESLTSPEIASKAGFVFQEALKKDPLVLITAPPEMLEWLSTHYKDVCSAVDMWIKYALEMCKKGDYDAFKTHAEEEDATDAIECIVYSLELYFAGVPASPW
jgi:hypothetical protein